MVLFQLRPFSIWELLYKERICSQRERILSYNSSSLWYGKSLLPHLMRPPLNVTTCIFITHMGKCLMCATPMLAVALEANLKVFACWVIFHAFVVADRLFFKINFF